MREILFRGKCQTGEWVEGGFLDRKGKPEIIDFDRGEEGDFTFNTQVDSKTVGQFTGLTDKNGKKIFEGDIVKSITHFYGNQKERITVISFEEIENDSFGEPYTIGYAILGSEYEVIGNIHDNPELLL